MNFVYLEYEQREEMHKVVVGVHENPASAAKLIRKKMAADRAAMLKIKRWPEKRLLIKEVAK